MNHPHPNDPHPGTVAVVRPFTCTCCGLRGARVMIRLGDPDRPSSVAVCPACDTRPSDLSVADLVTTDED